MSRPTCRRILSAVLLMCVLASTTPAIGDPTDTDDAANSDADYAAGKAAIQRKDWAEAVRRLLIAERRNPDNADLHNHLGYGYRNLKQFDRAFQHYERALALDPRHRGAHEYIGEAYLLVGDLANAERHLTSLRELCVLRCEELADLEKAISDYRGRRQ